MQGEGSGVVLGLPLLLPEAPMREPVPPMLRVGLALTLPLPLGEPEPPAPLGVPRPVTEALRLPSEDDVGVAVGPRDAVAAMEDVGVRQLVGEAVSEKVAVGSALTELDTEEEDVGLRELAAERLGPPVALVRGVAVPLPPLAVALAALLALPTADSVGPSLADTVGLGAPVSLMRALALSARLGVPRPPVPLCEGVFVHVAVAPPLPHAVGVLVKDTVAALEGEGAGERLSCSEGEAPAVGLRVGWGELLAEGAVVEDAVGRGLAEAGVEAEGEREEEGLPETLPVTDQERVGTPVPVGLAELRAEAQGEDDSEAVLEAEREAERLGDTEAVCVPGAGLALAQPLALAPREPLRDTELQAESVPLGVGSGAVPVVLALARSLGETGAVAVPVAAAPVLLPVCEGVTAREGDSDALTVGDALPLPAASEGVARKVLLAPLEPLREGEGQAEGEGAREGEVEAQDVTLHVAVLTGVALGEPVAERERGGEGEEDPQLESEGEALADRHMLGDGVAVEEAVPEPTELPLRPEVALRSTVALTSAESVLSAEGVAPPESVRDTEGHAVLVAHAVTVGHTLAVDDTEALLDPVAPREGVAAGVDVEQGVALALVEPLTVPVREGGALEEGAPLPVGVTEVGPEGVPLPPLAETVARCEAAEEGEAVLSSEDVGVAHGLAEALTQGVLEGLAPAVREGGGLPEDDTQLVGVAVSRCTEGVLCAVCVAEGQPEPLLLAVTVPQAVGDCEEQPLPEGEGSTDGDGVGDLLGAAPVLLSADDGVGVEDAQEEEVGVGMGEPDAGGVGDGEALAVPPSAPLAVGGAFVALAVGCALPVGCAGLAVEGAEAEAQGVEESVARVELEAEAEARAESVAMVVMDWGAEALSLVDVEGLLVSVCEREGAAVREGELDVEGDALEEPVPEGEGAPVALPFAERETEAQPEGKGEAVLLRVPPF